eukprot:Blabericola_migrator_1__13259@NODE_923_length_6034_cov_34_268309_g642_i0_p6_GENE_NODE_923_length_6034_cov_34_268309_g642_i0NODE_923_length_6034_cov_34_268309_g642_i0_p6_ORF_typecomplete_len114_score3_32_NODE_923_length_6034_cov_34_268309_g642_i017032044
MKAVVKDRPIALRTTLGLRVGQYATSASNKFSLLPQANKRTTLSPSFGSYLADDVARSNNKSSMMVSMNVRGTLRSRRAFDHVKSLSFLSLSTAVRSFFEMSARSALGSDAVS